MDTRDGTDPAIPPREHARIRHRDRKRETRMVVDNAGVKRVQRAIAERRRGEAGAPDDPESSSTSSKK